MLGGVRAAPREEQTAALQAWAREHGRLPKYGEGDAAERRLGAFLTQQRAHLSEDSAEALRRLDVLRAAELPGFDALLRRWSRPRRSFDDNAAELAEWAEARGGRFPKLGARDEQERRLAAFLGYIWGADSGQVGR